MSERTCVCGHQHEEHYLDVRGAPCGICACFAFRPAAVSAPAGEATPHDPTYFTDALFEAAKILGNTHGLDTKLMGAAHLLRHYAELARSPAPASEPEETTRATDVRCTWCIQGHPLDATGAKHLIHGAVPCNDPRPAAVSAPASGALDEEVTRYDMDLAANGYLCMTPCHDGDYVRHEDYTALRTRLAASERAGVALREERDRARNTITQIATTTDATSVSVEQYEAAMKMLEDSDAPDGYLYWVRVYVQELRGVIAARAALTPTSPAPSPEN